MDHPISDPDFETSPVVDLGVGTILAADSCVATTSITQSSLSSVSLHVFTFLEDRAASAAE